MLHYSLVPTFSGGYSSYTPPSNSSSYLPSRYATSARPIRIDTADIDVFRARPIRVSYTSPQGTIHRGRSVVRLQTSRYHTPRSPGARLVEKFRIKDPVISKSSVLPVGEPGNTSDAINRVSVCQVNQLSVPVVISSGKCEVSEETVVFPLKKTIVNCREVSVSLKQPKTNYTCDSYSYSGDVETSINITLNSNRHFRTSGLNQRTGVDDLGHHTDFIYPTNKSQQSRTIITKESGQKGNIVDDVPIAVTPNELRSTTTICDCKQETQESSSLINQESNEHSDKLIGRPESSLEIHVEHSTCSLPDESKGKVRKKKLKKSEKIGAKEGNKLKINKLNVALTDDIKSDTKIESKGQPTINTTGVTVIPDDRSNKPKILESISTQQGQSQLTIKTDCNSEQPVSFVSPTDQFIKGSNSHLEESREIREQGGYTKARNNKGSTADKTITRKDSSNSTVINDNESLSRSFNETNTHPDISDKLRQKDFFKFEEESNVTFLLGGKKVKENITKVSESILSGKQRRAESLVKVDEEALVESSLDNKVITRTETYTGESAGKESSLYSTLENQEITKRETEGKSPQVVSKQSESKKKSLTDAVPADKRVASSKPVEKAKESIGSKVTLTQVASKVETKAKSPSPVTLAIKRDVSLKADDQVRESTGGNSLTQAASKVETKAKSPSPVTSAIKRDVPLKADDQVRESTGGNSLTQVATKVETKAKLLSPVTSTNKRDVSLKADDKVRESTGDKDSLIQVATKVETKAKSPSSVTLANKRDVSLKADDKVRESTGDKDSLTQVVTKEETKAKSTSSVTSANKRDVSPKADNIVKESTGDKDSLTQVTTKVESKAKSLSSVTSANKRDVSPKADDKVKQSTGNKESLTQVATKVETKAKSPSSVTSANKRDVSPKADNIVKESTGDKESLTQVATKVETKAKSPPAGVPDKRDSCSSKAAYKGIPTVVCKDSQTFTLTSLRNKEESKQEIKAKSPPAGVPEKRESAPGVSDKVEDPTGCKYSLTSKSPPAAVSRCSTGESSLQEESIRKRAVNNLPQLSPIKTSGNASSNNEASIKVRNGNLGNRAVSCDSGIQLESLLDKTDKQEKENKEKKLKLIDNKFAKFSQINSSELCTEKNSGIGGKKKQLIEDTKLEKFDSDNKIGINEGNLVNGDALVGNSERNGNLVSDYRTNEAVVNSFGPESEIVGQPSDRSTGNDRKTIISCKVSEGECTVDRDCTKSAQQIACTWPDLVKIDSKVCNDKLNNSTVCNELSDCKISDTDSKQYSLISYNYKNNNSICEVKPELNKHASTTKKNKQLGLDKVKTKKSTSTGAIRKKVSDSGKEGKVKSLVKKKTTSIKDELKIELANDEDFEDEGLGKDYCSVKTSDGSTSLDSDWEQVEIEEMEDGVPKKKLIVRKKGSQVSITPLVLKPPAIVEDVAKTGQITRQLSKKRVSLVDEDLGFLEDRKMSITDEMIVEEAAVLDNMIHQELAASKRRKSSLGLTVQEVAQSEEPKTAHTLQDKRREIWKNKLRTSGKSLGKFYKPVIEETTSSSEDEEGSSDSESTESGADVAGACSGRISPPAKSLPRFRTYSIQDFQFLKVLGKGSFGKVLLAELKGSECYYAVKCLKKDVVLEDDDVECTMIERKVLALGTTHPYFCHLFCTFQTQSHLFFVMEYLNGGDLMFHIQQSGRFDEGRARFYAAEIVSALTFLHKWGIVYRDLKLDNVLLDFDGHVRIADFGMCKLQIYLDKTTDTFCGTPDYMAPEIIKGLKYNQCVDWWSFGILLYEMLVGQSPFSGCDEDDLFWSICNMRPHFPRHLSTEAKSILNAFLEKDWTKRLGSSENGASEVMNHEFFIGLKWHLLERRQLDPPFKPHMKHPLDTKYFDRAFTSEKPVLTPVDKSILESMDQTQFQGFSYTNPNATE